MRLVIAATSILLTFLAMAGIGPAVAADTATGTATGTVTVTVLRPIDVQNVAPLSFGTIVSGAGTVDVGISNNRTTSAGLVTAAGTVSTADFTITGEGGQLLSVLVAPVTPYLTRVGGSETIGFAIPTGAAFRSNIGTSIPLGGSLGSPSTIHALVGGRITLTGTPPAGVYTGLMTLAADYD